MNDYEKYIKEEQDYLKALKGERPQLDFGMEYVLLLEKLEQAKYVESLAARCGSDILVLTVSVASEKAKLEYDALIAMQVQTHDADKTKIKTRYHTTFRRYQAIEEEVLLFEEAHVIDIRWTSDSQEYCKAIKTLSERKYVRALDELERLVVQRLLEMSKLGIAGTGKLHLLAVT